MKWPSSLGTIFHYVSKSSAGHKVYEACLSDYFSWENIMEVSFPPEGTSSIRFTFWQRADILLFTFIMWLCSIIHPNNMSQLNGKVSCEHLTWHVFPAVCCTGSITNALLAYKANSAICEWFILTDRMLCSKDTSNRTRIFFWEEVKSTKQKGIWIYFKCMGSEFVVGINDTGKGLKLLNMVFPIFCEHWSKVDVKWCFQVNCKSKVEHSAETVRWISKD